jgi:hypothetical protein
MYTLAVKINRINQSEYPAYVAGEHDLALPRNQTLGGRRHLIG